MEIFRMRNLILISFIAIFISGCHFSLSHSWHRAKGDPKTGNLNSCFRQSDSNYLYLADIRFMKNYYSGIVAIKPFGDSLHRVVFMTELGMKIFDLEIKNPLKNKDFYTVHYMIEPMSKKIIQKTLAHDFGLLLQNPAEEKQLLYIGKNNENIFRIKNRRLRYFYIFEKGIEKYQKIMIESTCLKKTEVSYYGEENNYPDSIKINHMGIKLSYNFRKLKQ